MAIKRAETQRRFAQGALVSALLIAPCTWGEESDLFKFHGFGSLSASTTDNSRVKYKSSIQQPTPPNSAAGEWSFEPNSLIAGQLDIASEERLSATIQMIGTMREDGRFTVEPEWAFLRYNIDPVWSVRLGRVLTPVFLESDYRYVGYGRLSAKPSNQLFGFYPLSNHDGMDITYLGELGNGTIRAIGFVGQTKYDLPDDHKGREQYYTSNLLYGAALTWDNDQYLLRGAVVQAAFALDGEAAEPTVAQVYDPLIDLANRGWCDECASLAEEWDRADNGAKLTTYTLAGRANYGNAAFTLEGFYRKSDTMIPDIAGYEFTASYALGSFTPYVGFALSNTLSNDYQLVDANIPLPPGPARTAYVDGVKIINDYYQSQNIGREVFTLGVRWDVMDNVAVKLQAENWSLDSEYSDNALVSGIKTGGQKVMFNTVTIDRTRPTDFNLFTATIDFVF